MSSSPLPPKLAQSDLRNGLWQEAQEAAKKRQQKIKKALNLARLEYEANPSSANLQRVKDLVDKNK